MHPRTQSYIAHTAVMDAAMIVCIALSVSIKPYANKQDYTDTCDKVDSYIFSTHNIL